MIVNLYLRHESYLSILAVFNCSVLLLCYFLANKLPILPNGFLSSVSSSPFLLKKVWTFVAFQLYSHVWKISTLIPLLNILKKCPLEVQHLGTWNKHH